MYCKRSHAYCDSTAIGEVLSLKYCNSLQEYLFLPYFTLRNNQEVVVIQYSYYAVQESDINVLGAVGR